MSDVCLDCGTPMQRGLDGLALCLPCLAIAVRLCGSGEARVALITGGQR